jgi:hypothetical protein
MSNHPRKFWPFDDPEGEIYESLSWDLPGFRPGAAARPEMAAKKDRKMRRR